ncbi:MAG: hypothetical protein KGJ36_06445 [Acidobacteriota bacterium]|nr:hypothetical protein [Acidobacteriota bacterium]
MLRHHLSIWKRPLMSTALGCHSHGGMKWLTFSMIPDTYNDLALIDLLTQ